MCSFGEGDMKCTIEQHVHLNFYTSKGNFKKEYKVIRPAGKLQLDMTFLSFLSLCFKSRKKKSVSLKCVSFAFFF